jgi:hypothetical protein
VTRSSWKSQGDSADGSMATVDCAATFQREAPAQRESVQQASTPSGSCWWRQLLQWLGATGAWSTATSQLLLSHLSCLCSTHALQTLHRKLYGEGSRQGSGVRLSHKQSVAGRLPGRPSQMSQ